MKTRSYPITSSLWRACKLIALVLVATFLFIAGLEILRLGLLLRRVHPIAMYAYIGLLATLAFYLLVRYWLWRTRWTALHAPPRSDATASFRDLKAYVRHLIKILKRAAGHPLLTPDQARAARQRAYDLEGMLGAHPLIDDLRRGISRTESETWAAIVEHFDNEATKFARYKMQAVVRDAIEPPFPIVHSALIFYHQFTMISCIVDCYLTRPSLVEYLTVGRDVWRVLTGGDYFRIGQRLFEGIYRNSPPLGPAAQDLGQALSVIWLTWTTAQAAMHRCRAIEEWTVEKAIAHLDHLTIDSLIVTRDTLIRDVLPLLKLRLRHSVGPAVADAAGFSEEVMEGIVKSVDGVIQSLRTQAPEEAAEHSRRSLHGTYPMANDPIRRASSIYSAPEERPRSDGRKPA
jgi:hypothetical protein